MLDCGVLPSGMFYNDVYTSGVTWWCAGSGVLPSGVLDRDANH